jgi:hypothetical protein
MMLNEFLMMYENSVRTSQETHYVSATKINPLMLRTIRNTLCVQNAEL